MKNTQFQHNDFDLSTSKHIENFGEVATALYLFVVLLYFCFQLPCIAFGFVIDLKIE